jgi:hypothetical protein
MRLGTKKMSYAQDVVKVLRKAPITFGGRLNASIVVGN